MAEWLEIAVAITSKGADDVAALITGEVAAAKNGTEIRADEVVFWVAIEDGETALAQTRTFVAELAERGFAVTREGVTMRAAVPEKDWREAWKLHFRTTRLTRQIVVVPSWESFSPTAPDDIVIHLDPGQAFGTGAHGSTRLVLLEMQRAHDQGRALSRFLDVGTGSGLLSIAAAKLWPTATAVAIDNDAMAITVAAANSAKNQVTAQISCATTAVDAIDGAFELVVANIQADILVELCEAIAARVARPGLLVLSGVLDSQVDDVAGHYTEHTDLELEAITRSQDDAEFCSARLARS
jgi:ribosomal protein L11 methyltransferase